MDFLNLEGHGTVYQNRILSYSTEQTETHKQVLILVLIYKNIKLLAHRLHIMWHIYSTTVSNNARETAAQKLDTVHRSFMIQSQDRRICHDMGIVSYKCNNMASAAIYTDVAKLLHCIRINVQKHCKVCVSMCLQNAHYFKV